MFFEILAFMLLGISVGVLTGLAPGLHPNTVFAIVLSLSAFFLQFPAICTLAFIISLAVSNVFLDFIPSILFGAPDPDNCMSVLPGHKMLMEGRGYEAVFLSVIGGLGAMLLTILTLPLLLFAIPGLYSHLHPVLHVLLILVVGWMILTERRSRIFSALLIFLLSGFLGFITLNSLPPNFALFPGLTGLFGFSGLIMSLYGKSKLPPQRKSASPKTRGLKGTIAGWLAGMLAGLLPGVGSSQASAITSQAFKAKTKDFLISLGGINSANIIFTIIAFYTLGKTRSGAAWSISQLVPTLTPSDLTLLMLIALATCLISAILTLKTAGLLVGRISSISYGKINLSIIIFLAAAVALLSGPLGLFISLAGTLIGILAIKLGIKRSHMMGFLIFPTIIYFSGLTGQLSYLLGT